MFKARTFKVRTSQQRSSDSTCGGHAGAGVGTRSGLAGPGGSSPRGCLPAASERTCWGTTLCVTAAVNSDLWLLCLPLPPGAGSFWNGFLAASEVVPFLVLLGRVLHTLPPRPGGGEKAGQPAWPASRLAVHKPPLAAARPVLAAPASAPAGLGASLARLSLRYPGPAPLPASVPLALSPLALSPT